jgi:hypothetical protein
MIRRGLGSPLLFLATASVCLAAAPPRKPAPPKSKSPVVKRLVRLGTRAHMHSAPIVITLEPGAVDSSGRQRARVWIRPLVDAERMEVLIETWDGLTLARGRKSWQATARKDAAVSEDLLLAASGKGERGIVIAATLYFADGKSMGKPESFILNPGAPRTDTPLSTGREITLPDGKKLEVIPVQPGSGAP